ncbi:MAG: type II secretion system F family protein [bacterium]
MKYQYQAQTPEGAKQKGELEAENINAARKTLTERNLFVTEINALKPGFSSLSNIFHKIGMKEKLIFTEELSVMIKAGFPITKALFTLKEQTKNPKFSEILNVINRDVRGGMSLSESLGKHPLVFPELYTQAISAGEQSGNLDKILNRTATDMRKSYELSGKIKSAMVYPLFVFGVMIIILIAMLVFVLPQLGTLFKDMGVTLPTTTKFLLGFSDFFMSFWWIILIIVVGLIFAYQAYYKTDTGHKNIDRLKIKMWFIGPINQKIYLARITRNLNTLTVAGLPILKIFDTLKKTVGNETYKKELGDAQKKIEGGETISEALSASPYFSPLVIQLIKVGEESGDLPSTLETITNFLENEVDQVTKNLSTLIEPILIVILGIGAAFIVAAIILPIYNLTTVIT